MNITEICHARRDALLPRWVECFFAGYGLESSGFLRTRQDPFANPVGQTTRDALMVLYDAVAGDDADPVTVKNALDSLMRLRAVQDMAPSRAVGPLYLMKTILREAILPEYLGQAGRVGEKDRQAANAEPARLNEYLAMESRVDSLALMALDRYAGAREKVFQLRVEEIKRSQSQVVRWAKLRETAGAADTRNRNSEG